MTMVGGVPRLCSRACLLDACWSHVVQPPLPALPATNDTHLTANLTHLPSYQPSHLTLPASMIVCGKNAGFNPHLGRGVSIKRHKQTAFSYFGFFCVHISSLAHTPNFPLLQIGYDSDEVLANSFNGYLCD